MKNSNLKIDFMINESTRKKLDKIAAQFHDDVIVARNVLIEKKDVYAILPPVSIRIVDGFIFQGIQSKDI